MDTIFGYVFYVLFDVIFFRIGKWVIQVMTFQRIKVTMNGTSQPLISLLGLITVIGVVLTTLAMVRN